MIPETPLLGTAVARRRPLRQRRGWRGSQRGTERATQIFLLVVLGVGAIGTLTPFAWMVATSLSRSANDAMPRIPSFWPSDPSLFNYEVAVSDIPILVYYTNSVIVVVASTLGYLFFSALTGYAFAKGSFPGRGALFLCFLATLLIPFETRMIPLYLLMRDIRLLDSLPALIVPFLVGGFGTFLMRQNISTIPDDYIDAARIDGAGEFRIFWRIILPLCKAPLAALAIVNILWRWNDVLWPLMVTSDRANYTVTLGLALAGRASGIQVGVALATATLAILPVVFAYIVLQRHIIRGITMGGLKG
ncbi:carbohydrate ABC transporter permease [Microbacterium immunditiarum]|uniref:ABC-type glycerol-3-phosphate transport system permease component n=1 Tax=Microbacterium immunditiarum TaxID=337480 RepID=A0A7Y9GM70_9MICO|nr:carbohydrate ABC transporter permease [Microbacterium immunditiarum]NYE19036.1 ABC-type glycerol-3-phosphate transport system permease component [Microbacterium immunditiarum]